MSEPAWVRNARAALEEEAQRLREQERAKHDALVQMAERRRDPLGKFMRSKVAKRYTKRGREIVWVSVPLPLAEALRAEAYDAQLSLSRFMVELSALALPLWRDYRESFLHPQNDNVYVPLRVRSIMTSAINPMMPRIPKTWQNWHAEVERSLAESKPKRKQPKDATAAVLAGLGGGK